MRLEALPARLSIHQRQRDRIGLVVKIDDFLGDLDRRRRVQHRRLGLTHPGPSSIRRPCKAVDHLVILPESSSISLRCSARLQPRRLPCRDCRPWSFGRWCASSRPRGIRHGVAAAPQLVPARGYVGFIERDFVGSSLFNSITPRWLSRCRAAPTCPDDRTQAAWSLTQPAQIPIVPRLARRRAAHQ